MGIAAKLRRNALKDSIRASDIGSVRLPLGKTELVTGVIESRKKESNVRYEGQGWRQPPVVPILTSRGTMKIDDDPKVVFSCPRHSPGEVVVLPLYIRFARTDFVSPITNRDPHMVESKIQDCASSVGSI